LAIIVFLAWGMLLSISYYFDIGVAIPLQNRVSFPGSIILVLKYPNPVVKITPVTVTNLPQLAAGFFSRRTFQINPGKVLLRRVPANSQK